MVSYQIYAFNVSYDEIFLSCAGNDELISPVGNPLPFQDFKNRFSNYEACVEHVILLRLSNVFVRPNCESVNAAAGARTARGGP